MTTKYPIFYELENLQSSKKIKSQDNINEQRFPKSYVTRTKKINKLKFPSSITRINTDTELRLFAAQIYPIERQKNDVHKTLVTYSRSEFGELISSMLIKNYFQSHPNNRKALAQNIARHIKSVNLVLEVLDLGTARKIREGFDATVMLLAECGSVIISTLNHLQKPSLDNKDLLVLEKKWEILITSIACNSNIFAQKRFDVIIKLIPDSNRRSVKTAIIDALLIMEDEVDVESIKSQLEYFLSDSEHDEYVKEYAKEALKDI